MITHICSWPFFILLSIIRFYCVFLVVVLVCLFLCFFLVGWCGVCLYWFFGLVFSCCCDFVLLFFGVVVGVVLCVGVVGVGVWVLCGVLVCVFVLFAGCLWCGFWGCFLWGGGWGVGGRKHALDTGWLCSLNMWWVGSQLTEAVAQLSGSANLWADHAWVSSWWQMPSVPQAKQLFSVQEACEPAVETGSWGWWCSRASSLLKAIRGGVREAFLICFCAAWFQKTMYANLFRGKAKGQPLRLPKIKNIHCWNDSHFFIASVDAYNEGGVIFIAQGQKNTKEDNVASPEQGSGRWYVIYSNREK